MKELDFSKLMQITKQLIFGHNYSLTTHTDTNENQNQKTQSTKMHLGLRKF